MVIETRPYEFTEKELFRLTLRAYFVRQGWGYLAAGLAVIIFSVVTGRSVSTVLLLTIFAVVVLVGIPFYSVWRYAHETSHQAFLGKRRCSFGPEGLYFYGEKGNARVSWLDVLSVSRTGNYYLFFVDKIRFFYVPFDAFLNPADRETIDHFLHHRKLI